MRLEVAVLGRLGPAPAPSSLGPDLVVEPLDRGLDHRILASTRPARRSASSRSLRPSARAGYRARVVRAWSWTQITGCIRHVKAAVDRLAARAVARLGPASPTLLVPGHPGQPAEVSLTLIGPDRGMGPRQPAVTKILWWPSRAIGGRGLARPSGRRPLGPWLGPRCCAGRGAAVQGACHWTQVVSEIGWLTSGRLPLAVIDANLDLGDAAVRGPGNAADEDGPGGHVRATGRGVDPRLGQDRRVLGPAERQPSNRRPPRASSARSTRSHLVADT